MCIGTATCATPIYFCNIKMKHLQHPDETSKTLETQACNMRYVMSPCCLDEVTEQRGHASEGERRDGQELPHAEVEVPAREVRIVERPEEVVVVVPHAAEDVRLVDHAGVDEVSRGVGATW